MRQGPNYPMPVELDENDYLICPVPLEFVDDLMCADSIIWVSNPDGSYTLTPHMSYN